VIDRYPEEHLEKIFAYFLDEDEPSSAIFAMSTTFAEKIVTGLAAAVVLAGLAAGRLTARADTHSYEPPVPTAPSLHRADHSAAAHSENFGLERS